MGLLSLVLLASCAPSVLDARLYDVDGGEVLQVQFTYDGSGRGKILFVGHDDRLEGEYVTIFEGSRATAMAWGGIFSRYYSVNATEKALRGTGVAASVMGTGWFLECEYVTNGPNGQGVCKDNRGKFYRLLF